MKQTIEIEVPDGKKAIWKDNKIIFEDIKPPLPKTWEEFCNNYPIKHGEFLIDASSQILAPDWINRHTFTDTNILPSYKAAEAHLALMQLHQLRDCYRQGWIPTEDKVSFGITKRIIIDNCIIDNCLSIDRFMYYSRFLSFPTKEIAEEFLTNFRELIEQAGDLI